MVGHSPGKREVVQHISPLRESQRANALQLLKHDERPDVKVCQSCETFSACWCVSYIKAWLHFYMQIKAPLMTPGQILRTPHSLKIRPREKKGSPMKATPATRRSPRFIYSPNQ